MSEEIQNIQPYKVLVAFELDGVEQAVDTHIGLTAEAATDLVEAGHIELVEPEMHDHVVTEADLEANPELKAEGVEVGQTIQLPVWDKEVLREIGVDVDEAESDSDESESE